MQLTNLATPVRAAPLLVLKSRIAASLRRSVTVAKALLASSLACARQATGNPRIGASSRCHFGRMGACDIRGIVATAANYKNDPTTNGRTSDLIDFGVNGNLSAANAAYGRAARMVMSVRDPVQCACSAEPTRRQDRVAHCLEIPAEA